MSIKAASNTPPHAQTFDAIYPGKSQKIDMDPSVSKQSAVMGDGTTVVQVSADNDCFLAFGPNPTAAIDGTSMFLREEDTRLYAINPGDKIAVRVASGAGTLYITEGA